MIFPHKKKLNNAGYTLVELIVVIAIMGVLVGGVTIGAGLAFSKDASRCATRLNDEIYEARMNSMSKAGRYTLTVKNSGNANEAVISCSDITPAIDDKVMYLDDSENDKKTEIKVYFRKEGAASEEEKSLPVTIQFDKAKGNATVSAAGVELGEGILIFKIEAKRGQREAKVQLVTSTGKHTIGEFN